MLAEFFLKTFFVWFFPGQTIRVPWKEDSARGSVQKFEVNPVNIWWHFKENMVKFT